MIVVTVVAALDFLVTMVSGHVFQRWGHKSSSSPAVVVEFDTAPVAVVVGTKIQFFECLLEVDTLTPFSEFLYSLHTEPVPVPVLLAVIQTSLTSVLLVVAASTFPVVEVVNRSHVVEWVVVRFAVVSESDSVDHQTSGSLIVHCTVLLVAFAFPSVAALNYFPFVPPFVSSLDAPTAYSESGG